MRLLLDTSFLISLYRNEQGARRVLAALQKHFLGAPSISLMTYMEFYEGTLRKDEHFKEKERRFLRLFPMLMPTLTTAEIMAELKREHESKGSRLGLADIMIAAQALEEKCALVTSDGDFRRIKGLQVVPV